MSRKRVSVRFAGRVKALACAALLCEASAAFAGPSCDVPASVCSAPTAGAATLIANGSPAGIYADAHDLPGVLRAVRNLRQDLSQVAGASTALYDSVSEARGPLIIVGTLGHSDVIDRLVAEHRLDVKGVAGEWEAYSFQVIEQPLPGVARALVVAGADKRGTIFGAYELAARLGVSPWTWWADVPVSRRTSAYLSPGRFVDKPSVRYRGIFLNDEDPALSGWANQAFGGLNHRFYEHVYELILRLKGNLLWPAMWGKALYDDDRESPILADEMGVVIGTSHHEPMMRAHVEWSRHGTGPWDYTLNADRLRAFWREGIERMGRNESIVTVGMRGDGDKPMTEGTAVGLLEGIVAEQRRIIADVTGRPASQTPQVWALYKEVQDYYDKGMTVPEDVTLLFSDDNWGNLRRLPPPGAQRPGGYGIYYHFDYVGGPRSYKWLNTIQVERTWEQMNLAYEHGADRIWIVNVGDLKPLEYPTSFFLDYAWNPRAVTVERLRDYPREWAAQQFGAGHAAAIGTLLTRYTQFNARRKPELLAPDTYSLVSFHEAQRVVAQYNALAQEARQIGDTLPSQYRAAYFELVLFPIEICANLNELYVSAGLNRLYAAQGRASANEMAARVEALFARDAALTRQFHERLAGGKWNHMMSQTHLGYTTWREPKKNLMPEVRRLPVRLQPGLGIAVEGDTGAWPRDPGKPSLPELTPFTEPSRYFEIFNTGSTPLHFTARSSQPWLTLSQSSGDVTGQVRVETSVDWPAVPAGDHLIPITISAARETVVVTAHVLKPTAVEAPHTAVEGSRAAADASRTAVEADGYAAMEAAHFARAVGSNAVKWVEVPALGRTLSAMTMLPSTAPAQTPGPAGPVLEYRVFLFHSGNVSVRVTTAPSLDSNGGAGLRYAVSVDDDPPQVVNINAGTGRADWDRWVSDNANERSTTHGIARPGVHTVKIWMIDPGIAFERLILATRDLPPSYLGPPESFTAARDLSRTAAVDRRHGGPGARRSGAGM